MLTLREHANRCAKDAMKMETGVGGGVGGGRSPAPSHADAKRSHQLLYQIYNKDGGHPANSALREHTNCCAR